jgi:hypothetical protein
VRIHSPYFTLSSLLKIFFFLFGFSEHNPAEDMHIAIHRPNGAWHFTDSPTPFTPVVSETDVTPSPISTRSTASLLFYSSLRFPSNKAKEARTARDPTTLASESTQRFRRRCRHIIASYVNPTLMMITVLHR